MNEISNFGFWISEWRKLNFQKNSNLQYAIRSPQSYGFTLLEVLIAVAIMAGIISVVYASFFTSSRNVEQAEVIRDSTDMARTLVQKIASDVANAYVINPSSASIVPTVFIGKKEEAQTEDVKSRHDSLTLTTLTNGRRLNSKETELWEVAYYFKQKPDGSEYILMRREKRELSKDVPAGEGGFEYEITDRVKALQLRYSPTGAATGWLDEWNSTNRSGLPKFVEITLALESGMTYSMYVEVGSIKQ
jgi:prepilin-type N-terminal cleavage/methylation domain-containing protein